jgi:hypothetical protein
MVGAVLAAAPYVLNALGGLVGKKKKYLDARELERRFGAQAVSERAQKLYQTILASPYGQQLIAQASQAGQEFQTATSRKAAEAGLSPDSGASSGTSTFATGAAASAASNLEAQQKAGIYGQVLPAAQQMVAAEAAAEGNKYADQNATLTPFQKIAAAAGQVAGGLGAAGVGQPTAAVTPGTAPQPTGFEAPGVASAQATPPLMPNTTMPPPAGLIDMVTARNRIRNMTAPRASRSLWQPAKGGF